MKVWTSDVILTILTGVWISISMPQNASCSTVVHIQDGGRPNYHILWDSNYYIVAARLENVIHIISWKYYNIIKARP